VLYRLKKSGYQAYLVGGCVRDLLLGREPKDFDVVTDARPEDVKRIFRNCRLIGRRFRLAHICFGRDVVEVATFRGSEKGDRVIKDGRLIRDNVYGTIEEDAWRRDFSVNALYYNIRDFSLVDYVGGIEDHQAGSLRLIGDPEERYREDPVRMLRAIRFATKLGFNLHSDSALAIKDFSFLLRDVPPPRLYDEVLKLFLSGYAVQTFEQLRHYDLFKPLFPDTDKYLETQNKNFPSIFLAKALENADRRLAEGKSVTPYFLFAIFLWGPLRTVIEQKIKLGQNESNAFHESVGEVILKQVQYLSFPRRVSAQVREVWSLQWAFKKTVGGAPYRLLRRPRFRAAYDFFVLRAETGEADPEIAKWWTTFQEASDDDRKKMTRGKGGRQKKRPRRKRSNQVRSATIAP